MTDKEKALRKLLEGVLLRRQIYKEFKAATDAMEAKLRMEMQKAGVLRVEGSAGGDAGEMPSTSVKMPDDPHAILRALSPKTMAYLLAGTTVNKTNQMVLDRIGAEREALLVTSRSAKFTVNLPRTKDQKAAMKAAIANDLKEMEAKAEALAERFLADDEEVEGPPEPAEVDQVIEEKKAKAKKKAAKPAKKKAKAKKKKKAN